MASYNLRPYQVQALEIATANFKEKRNTILALPVGSGRHLVCSLIIKRILKSTGGSVLVILPTKAIEANYLHILKENQVDGSRVVFMASTNRDRLNALNANSIDAVIFDSLDKFPTKITEHVELLFKCPKVIMTIFMNPPIEMISFYKGNHGEVDFRLSLNEVIQQGVLQSVNETGSKEFLNLQHEIERLGLGSEISSIKDILAKVEEYQLSLKDISVTIDYFLKSGIAKAELEQLDLRKQQLQLFNKLLGDTDYYDTSGGNERVWQDFFERNTWIFGYGLTFIFNEPLKDKKLEQVVSGYSVKESGKRTDALMKSKGLISTLCFTEIKTHKKPLLKSTQYRDDSWPISDELAGGIAQLQKTIHLSLNNLSSKLDIKNSEGFLDEAIYLYRPKAYLIIGSLSEFTNDKGQINESKHSSFELFRRSLDIEIITFDELYHRASAIVQSEIK